MCVMLSLSVCIPGRLKRLLDHGGNRTRDLWFASPMLYQLSYEVKSVRGRDISELSLVSSISVCFNDLKYFFITPETKKFKIVYLVANDLMCFLLHGKEE